MYEGFYRKLLIDDAKEIKRRAQTDRRRSEAFIELDGAVLSPSQLIEWRFPKSDII